MPSGYVGGSGPKDALIAFVGEQPAKYEAKTGICFSGPAGKNFDECLHAAKILRNDVYVTNVIKDTELPLEVYAKITTGKYGKAVWSPPGKAYLDFLKDELASISANVIVPMGNTALAALCDRVGITSWRGSVIRSSLLPNKKVVPTIHPAVYTGEKLRQNPDAYLNKYLITLDMKKAAREAAYPEFRFLERAITIKPNYYEVMEYLAECRQYGERGGIIMYDIEISPKTQELSCISIALGPQRCMTIPFVDHKGDYFSASEELEIMLRLNELFSNERWKKGGQNIGFDSHFLLKKYGIRTRNYEDTMVAQRIIYPEFPRGGRLNFITAMWTDIPYYKADGKLWITGRGEYEKGWNYCAYDSLSCADAFPKQLAEIEERSNMAAYERQKSLIAPLAYMMEHGMKVDVEGMKKEHERCDLEVQMLVLQLAQRMNRPVVALAADDKSKSAFNIGSSKQLAQYFYVEKGYKPIFNKDKITTDEDALKLLIRRNKSVEAGIILQIRKLNKRKSTFLDITKVDEDGRIRCSYNPVGTKFGRISSSANIFGTGTNLQNVPHSVLSYFLIDDGYVGYSLDMSQIENRIVAYVGNILSMIEVFEKGRDMHCNTGTLLWPQLSYDYIRDETNLAKDLGDGTHSWRDWAKKANHAFNYNFGPGSFAMKYECALDEAKELHQAYHRAYPELESDYWAYVQHELRTKRYLTNLMDRRVYFLGHWGEKLLNEAYSCIPQGTCGDHVNERGLNFVYYNDAPHFAPVELLSQVHDSIDFQIPLSVPLEEHARVLIDVKRSLETPLKTHKGKEFVVPADLTVKFTMNKKDKKSAREIKGKEFVSDEKQLAVKLREVIVAMKGEEFLQSYERALV